MIDIENDPRKELKDGKSLPLLEVKDWKELEKPLSQAVYKNSVGRPKKLESQKCKWNDRIKCEVCAVEFLRSNRTEHNRTKIHLAYSKMHKKMKQFLLKE